jgi:hypothetical protein
MELPAGGSRHGRHGGIVVDGSPAVGTSAYTSGVQMGSVMELKRVLVSENGCARLDSVTVIDKDGQKGSFDILFFSQVPSALPADNGAMVLAAADQANLLGVVSVSSADYKDIKASSYSIASEKLLGLLIYNDTPKTSTTQALNTSVWASCISRDTKTYINGLKLRFGFV